MLPQFGQWRHIFRVLVVLLELVGAVRQSLPPERAQLLAHCSTVVEQVVVGQLIRLEN